MIETKTIHAKSEREFQRKLDDAINYLWEPIWESFRHSLSVSTTNSHLGIRDILVENYVLILKKEVPDPAGMCNTCTSILMEVTLDGIKYICLEREDGEDELEDDNGYCEKYDRRCYKAEKINKV